MDSSNFQVELVNPSTATPPGVHEAEEEGPTSGVRFICGCCKSRLSKLLPEEQLKFCSHCKSEWYYLQVIVAMQVGTYLNTSPKFVLLGTVLLNCTYISFYLLHSLYLTLPDST